MDKYSPILKFNYPVIVRVSGLFGILLITFGFLFIPRSFEVVVLEDADQIIIEQIDIPLTQQIVLLKIFLPPITLFFNPSTIDFKIDGTPGKQKILLTIKPGAPLEGL